MSDMFFSRIVGAQYMARTTQLQLVNFHNATCIENNFSLSRCTQLTGYSNTHASTRRVALDCDIRFRRCFIFKLTIPREPNANANTSTHTRVSTWRSSSTTRYVHTAVRTTNNRPARAWTASRRPDCALSASPLSMSTHRRQRLLVMGFDTLGVITCSPRSNARGWYAHSLSRQSCSRSPPWPVLPSGRTPSGAPCLASLLS